MSRRGAHGLADAETGKILFDCASKWDEFFIEEQRIRFVENGKKAFVTSTKMLLCLPNMMALQPVCIILIFIKFKWARSI